MPCKKGRQAGERRLAVLAEGDGLIRLKGLEPGAESELVAAAVDTVMRSSKVNKLRATRRLLPLLLPASPTCACGLEAALPPTTTAPTGSSRQESGNTSRRGAGRWFAGKEIAGA